MTTALPRSKVRKNQTWNAESVFLSPEQFDAEVESLVGSLDSIRKFQGHLGDSSDNLLQAMEVIENISERAANVQRGGHDESAGRGDERQSHERACSSGRGDVVPGPGTVIDGRSEIASVAKSGLSPAPV